jgi:hypothetical protein
LTDGRYASEGWKLACDSGRKKRLSHTTYLNPANPDDLDDARVPGRRTKRDAKAGSVSERVGREPRSTKHERTQVESNTHRRCLIVLNSFRNMNTSDRCSRCSSRNILTATSLPSTRYVAWNTLANAPSPSFCFIFRSI